MRPVSVVIITQNEADNIRNALESVQWADDIVVVDSGSTDDTIQIAKQFTDRIVSHKWAGYGAQKNYGASLAAHDWILSLDADERISSTLAEEIRLLLENEPTARGYRMPRVTRYLGQWIRTTDWYPDYQLRLYDRRAARWSTPLVHESVSVDGPVEYLRSELEHFAYRNISQHLATIDRYTTLAARQMLENGQQANTFNLAVHPIFAFLRNYIARGGFRSGSVGFIVSLLNSYDVFLKLSQLWEAQHSTIDE
ncbi:MAG: glycosyltransferase family 2 protein [Acidobacteriota bacterium]|nr:glycosyltransferase family 2 protein [Acidobacteriota bacterium]